MPVTYVFRRPDGDDEVLDEVDRQLCAAFGQDWNPSSRSMQYQILICVGIVAATGPRGEVTKETIAKYFDNEATREAFESDAVIAVYTDFLCGRYTFYASR